MEPGRNEQLAHLQRLKDNLSSQGFTAQLLDTASQPCVKVANPDNAKLNERVLCRTAEDGSWCFWWSWQQPIGSADDVTDVTSRIMTVLRSVEGAS
jgi:hypothetical protein